VVSDQLLFGAGRRLIFIRKQFLKPVLKPPFEKGGFRGIFKGLSNPPAPPFTKGGGILGSFLMETTQFPPPQPSTPLGEREKMNQFNAPGNSF
jgi:hypothetical protein